jgi:DNA-binding NarL/FixJ family response regulator
MPEAVIRVAIVEDQNEVREGLALLIDGTPGYQCLHQFASMEDALEKIGRDLPDVVLCDIGLPGMSGIEGIRRLREEFDGLQILMLTIYDDDERIFQAMCAGACGYLLKKTAPEKLLESLREVVAGGAPMSPEVARRVVGLFRTIRPKEASTCQLTPQELRLLKLLGEGHHYKTAAAELGVTINTISFHLRAIYGKLQVHSKSEAVAKALRDGLIH